MTMFEPLLRTARLDYSLLARGTMKRDYRLKEFLPNKQGQGIRSRPKEAGPLTEMTKESARMKID